VWLCAGDRAWWRARGYVVALGRRGGAQRRHINQPAWLARQNALPASLWHWVRAPRWVCAGGGGAHECWQAVGWRRWWRRRFARRRPPRSNALRARCRGHAPRRAHLILGAQECESAHSCANGRGTAPRSGGGDGAVFDFARVRAPVCGRAASGNGNGERGAGGGPGKARMGFQARGVRRMAGRAQLQRSGLPGRFSVSWCPCRRARRAARAPPFRIKCGSL